MADEEEPSDTLSLPEPSSQPKPEQQPEILPSTQPSPVIDLTSDDDAPSPPADITPERPSKRCRSSRRSVPHRHVKASKSSGVARKTDNDEDEAGDVPEYEAEHINGYFEVDEILDRKTSKYSSKDGVRQVVEYCKLYAVNDMRYTFNDVSNIYSDALSFQLSAGRFHKITPDQQTTTTHHGLWPNVSINIRWLRRSRSFQWLPILRGAVVVRPSVLMSS